jgi:predicted histidine transporter YuiF (NhaC family)
VEAAYIVGSQTIGGYLMSTFFSYIAISLSIFLIVEWLMRKKLNVPYKRRTALKESNNYYKWIERVFWALFLISVVFIHNRIFFALFIILFMAFDSFMQWKYNRANKEFIISLMGLISFIVFIAVGFTFGYFY